MIAWNVYSRGGWVHDRNGRLVRLHTDKVFGGGDTADEVRRSLIDHDGYPDDIVVTKERSRGRTAKST